MSPSAYTNPPQGSAPRIARPAPTIQMQQLTIGYPTRQHREPKVVARDITADVYPGELTCLLGSNGIGKSTLLRTLSAFQPKLSGIISILGRELEHYRERELAHLVSVVLTEKPDLRHMTVRELIALGRSPYTGFWGQLSRADEAEIERAIELVRIPHLTERMAHTLSDGERQKTMIAKALAQDTPIILLDEPTAFLDFPSKVEMMQLLHRLSRTTHKTILLSTHDLELALQIADKVWLIDDKAQLYTGTPEDLSLSGVLSHFFARKGITFDQESGLFRVENECSRTIHLQGHGYRYAMVRKALLRHGIAASRHESSPDSITITSDTILYHEPTGTTTLSTIEELLTIIHHDHD